MSLGAPAPPRSRTPPPIAPSGRPGTDEVKVATGGAQRNPWKDPIQGIRVPEGPGENPAARPQVHCFLEVKNNSSIMF